MYLKLTLSKFIIENAHLNVANDTLIQIAMKERLIVRGIKVPTREQLDFATKPGSLNLDSRDLVRGAMNERLIACGINVPTPEQLDFAVGQLNAGNYDLKQGAMKVRLQKILGREPTREEILPTLTILNGSDTQLCSALGISDPRITQQYRERRLQRERLFEAGANGGHSYYIEALNLFQVAVNATDDQIKIAYKKLAIRHHPDRNHGNEEAANAAFKEISAAKEYIDFYRENNFQRGWNPRFLPQNIVETIFHGW